MVTYLSVCLFFLFHPCTFKKLPDEPDLQEKGVCFLKNYLSFLFKTTNAIISVVINTFKGGFINLQYTFSVAPSG